jgi:hypothetical protein
MEWSGAPPVQITPWPPTDCSNVSVASTVTKMGIASLGNCSIELVADHSWNFAHWRAEISRDVAFRLDFGAGHRLDAILGDFVYPLRDLLAFLTLGYTGIEPLGCVPLDAEDRGGMSRYGRYYVQLQRPIREPKVRTSVDMLATWPRLGVDFDWLITNWWRLVERQAACIRMMLVPTYAPYLYADDQLLTAFLALEAYHDRALDQHSVDPKDHTKRVDEVLALMPEEHREWVEERLRNGNTKGQRRKLDEVIQRSGSTGERIVAALPDFARLAIKARQQVAQPVHDPSHDAGQHLVYLGQAIRWLLRHCLLLDHGYDEAAVTALLSGCNALTVDLTLLGRLST